MKKTIITMIEDMAEITMTTFRINTVTIPTTITRTIIMMIEAPRYVHPVLKLKMKFDIPSKIILCNLFKKAF